eukprot:2488769-Ditylum_brightwellii.AAC.1
MNKGAIPPRRVAMVCSICDPSSLPKASVKLSQTKVRDIHHVNPKYASLVTPSLCSIENKGYGALLEAGDSGANMEEDSQGEDDDDDDEEDDDKAFN